MALVHRFAFLVLGVLGPVGLACGGSAATDPIDEAAPAAPSPPPATSAPVAPDAATGPSGDAGLTADAASDLDAAKPVCNGLVNVAPEVPIVAEASAPPPAGGGAIADGTYVVTGATLHTGLGGATGPTGSTTQMTVAISGTTVELVFDGVTRSATFAVAGIKLQTTTTCPRKAEEEVEYTATPSSLALYLLDSAGTRVYSLEKL